MDWKGWCRLCGHLEGTLKVQNELEHQIAEVFQVNLLQFSIFRFLFTFFLKKYFRSKFSKQTTH